MWNTNPQPNSAAGGGLFNVGQSGTGKGMGFSNSQSASGMGVFGNQPTASSGTSLFNTGFSNPSGSGAVAIPSSQPTSTFGGFGMQSNTNTMGAAHNTGTGLFNIGTTNTMVGMNTGMGAGVGQPNSLFSSAPPVSNSGEMFGASTRTGGGMFRNPGASNGMLGNQPLPCGSLYNTASSTFGQSTNTDTTSGSFFGNMDNMGNTGNMSNTGNMGNMGNTMTQPTNNTLFGATPNNQNSMFGGVQNNQNQALMFNKLKSGFLGNNQPQNNTFNFNSGNNTFGASTTSPSTFNPNNAKGFQPKKFQPTKPKNESLSKEKNSNSLVACLSNTDEYSQFCKDELRIMYLINPAQFQVTQQTTTIGQINSSFNQPNNSMFSQSNNSFGQNSGMTNQPANSLFNGPTNAQQQASGMFSQTPNLGVNTNTNPLLGNQNTNSSVSLFGATNNTLNQNAVNQANKIGTSLFGQMANLAPSAGGLLQSSAPNVGSATGLFNVPGGIFNTSNPTSMFGNPQSGSVFPAPNIPNNSGSSLFPEGSIFNAPATQQPGSLFPTSENANILNNPQAQQAITGSMLMLSANNLYPQSGSQFAPGSSFPQNHLHNQSHNLFPPGSLFLSMNASMNSQGIQGNAFNNLSGVIPTRKNIFSSTSYYENINSVPGRPLTAAPADSLFITTPAVTHMSNLITTDLMSSLREDKRVDLTNRYYSQEVEDYERARREIQRRFDDDIVSKLGPSEFGYIMPDYSNVEYNLSRRNLRDPERYNDYIPIYMTHKASSIRYEQPQVFVRGNMQESSLRPSSTLRSQTRESVFSKRLSDDDEYDNSLSNLRKVPEPVDSNDFKKKAVLYNRKDDAMKTPINDKLANIDDIPVCKKLNIKPSLMELSRMTKEQLKRVTNLEVYNNYGKIQWTHPVSLVGINLDDWITIRQNSIEIEQDLACGGGCILHFFNFGNYTQKSKNSSNNHNFKTKMIQWLRDRHLKMINFSDETGELVTTYDG